MVTAREALFAAVKINNTPEKTFYIALVDGYPQAVSAKGIHRSGRRCSDFMKIRARIMNEAARKFFNEDGEWVN